MNVIRQRKNIMMIKRSMLKKRNTMINLPVKKDVNDKLYFLFR